MYSHPREDRIWEFFKRRKTGISLIKHPDSIYFRMTIRYVMCFTVHYLKKKNLAEKKLKRALPNSPFHLKVVFGEDLLGSLWSFRPILRPCYHVFSCHPMLSHVIPKWPRGENMVTECNWKFWDYPNHPILSRVVIGMIPSCDLQKWPDFAKARCKYPRPPWPNAPSSSDCWDPSSRAFAKGWWLGSLSMVGICAIFDGFPGNLCL